ncbi:MAG: CinA family protein, partial [Tardiphaga sp.]
MAQLDAACERLLRGAQQRKLTLLTVESCTAGALACALAQVEGAAQTLHGGFVVYTKANKTAALGIDADLIATHTAVS